MSDALNVMEKSTIIFYAKSNPTEPDTNSEEKIKIVIKSDHGTYYGGVYDLCDS